MNDSFQGQLAEFAHLLDTPRQQGTALGNWRWTVRQRLSALRDALAREAQHGSDGWLAARNSAVLRQRNELMHRMATLAPAVLESPDVEKVRSEMRRLLSDVHRHRQRVSDLAYDEVELELGGSE